MADSTNEISTPAMVRLWHRRRPIRLPPRGGRYRVAAGGGSEDAAQRGARQRRQRSRQQCGSREGLTHFWKPWGIARGPSAFEGVEVFRVDAGMVAHQQHQDGQADGRFGGGHRHDEEHEHLPVHVAQVMGERDEVGVDRQQHQFDRHQQHDQVLAVQEDPCHRQREQHRPQHEEMAQGQRHAFFSPATGVAGIGAGALRVAAIRTSSSLSLARTRICAAASMALLSLRWRSVSAIAAIIATSRITAAISTGNRYSVYSSLPRALLFEYASNCPAASSAMAKPALGSSVARKPPISTAAISSAISAPTLAASGKCFQKPRRKLSMWMSSIITTNKNSTITAPRYTSTSVIARNSALSSNQTAAACEKAKIRYSTACTGLRAVITRKAANSSTTEKR